MTEFGITKKLRNLVRMCMEGTQYQIRVDQAFSETFTVEAGLKQGDALFPLLFNLAQEKAIREVQKEITGNTRDDIEKATKVLEKSADKIGLKINIEKTKIMELLYTDVDVMDPDPDI
ncbi:Reverse transcriptase domain [Cinara cedri]|uniref:Reverse transcriptase domain n=1 Tax=Cinara cedri TaxID=506608 RepID=A0A5E4MCT9_9HEMI|nr:Reverse transcriptase domain [Cinara cedri]